MECAEKYDLKNRPKDSESPPKTKPELNSNKNITNKSRYSRGISRKEFTLAKLLEDKDLPLDLERNKNLTLNDIKKFVSYIFQSLGKITPSSSEEVRVEYM